MTNSNLLKAEMVKKGYTQRTLSKAIGLNVNSLNLKINNNGSFNTDEVAKLCDVLEITDDHLKCDIFLRKPSQN